MFIMLTNGTCGPSTTIEYKTVIHYVQKQCDYHESSSSPGDTNVAASASGAISVFIFTQVKST